MIILTKLNGEIFTLNCDMIETVQENPDTTIHLNNGQFYIVRESMVDVIQKSVEYHQQIFGKTLHSEF
ncbi:MAG: flagellar FlbD family protein [Provencibacterium sp.]|nr:flagellar FlbD family protein [Provencibacterium sp.]